MEFDMQNDNTMWQEMIVASTLTRWLKHMKECWLGKKRVTRSPSPLPKGDQPEIYRSEPQNNRGITRYLLGQFDICTAAMILSGYSIARRKGHLDEAKLVCSYLAQMKNSAIRFQTNVPNYSTMPTTPCNWEYSIYGEQEEMMHAPDTAQEPKRHAVVLTHYML
jgi:hypothetical protein